MKALLDAIGQELAIKTFNSKKNVTLVVSDNQQEAIALASAFLASNQKTIIIKKNLYSAQRLFERIANLLPSDKCLFFPVDESFRVEAIASSQELLTQRLYVIDKILSKETNIIITHPAAIMRHLPNVELFKAKTLNLKVGQKFKMNHLVEHLNSVGYEAINKVEHSLQFARRGGVVDVFSINYNDPIRIEFLGDEIDSIRFFDLNTQKTKQIIDTVRIIPATDLILNEAALKQLENLKEVSKNKRIQSDLETLLNNPNYSLSYKYYSKANEVSSLIDYASDYKISISNKSLVDENYKLLVSETFEYLDEEGLLELKLHHDFNYEINKVKTVSYLEEFKTSEKDLELPLGSVDSSYGIIRRLRIILIAILRIIKL